MKKIRKNFFLKPTALYLILACLFIFSIPRTSWAYFVESQTVENLRSADMEKIQRVLESKVIGQRLTELGFSADEINSRLNELSDADIHQFASRLDSLMPGGDTITALMGLLVITILVLVILQILGYKVIIK